MITAHGAQIMESRILTVSTLVALGACIEQRAKFKALFGDSVEITEALCVEHASTFNFDWAALHLLSAPARSEYERVRAAAWAEYERVTAAAWAEYDRVTAAAFARAYINDQPVYTKSR